MNQKYRKWSLKTITRVVIISTFLGINFITACKRQYNCSERQNRVFFLNASDKGQVACTNIDTVAFVNNLGDTSVLLRQDKIVSFKIENGMGDPDCGWGRDSFEINTFKYKTIKGSMNLTLSLTKTEYDGNLFITVDNYDYYFNYNYYITTFDSLEVNNKIYYKVSAYRPSSIFGGSIYYNSSQGVIKVNTWSRL